MSHSAQSRYFPPADTADRHGIVAVGGKLDSDWIVDAYRHGIFPWPTGDGWLAWWSPDPRGIIEFADLHISQRLARTIRSGRFQVTRDQDFAGVIDGCATAQDREEETWITSTMREAYVRLHGEGIAHSVEVWHEGQLAGGIYGLSIGGLFAGESMFYRVSDASKVALVHLVEHLRQQGFALFDVQMVTAHTRSMGAKTISRRAYLRRLAAAVDMGIRF